MTPPHQELRALVIENDASNRELLARVLRLHGCAADTAIGGEQGLQRLHAHAAPYDLLLTDLKMEPVDGVELLRQVEKLPADRRPRAITVLSGHLAGYYESLSNLHLELELFQKPIHLPSLVRILDRLKAGKPPAADRAG